MSGSEPWQRLLRDALAVLALPPDEQVRANGPGCVACDLSEAFYHSHSVALECASQLSNVQSVLLGRIETAIRSMQAPDVECGNEDVLRRPAWQELRQMADEALWAFGWQGVPPPPSVEIQPGVWHRPLAGIEGEGRPDGGKTTASVHMPGFKMN